MTPLPTSEEFLAQFGIVAGTESKPVVEKKTPPPAQPKGGVSTEFKRLLVHYCASRIEAFALEDIRWDLLARQLGTHKEFLAEAAKVANEDGSLWHDVFEERIRRTGALKLFRDADWEKLEANAVRTLLSLAERNLIKDVGELLAIARVARQASEVRVPSNPNTGNNVNINFNGGGVMPESELPGAGAKMTIDLSPRSAQALAEASGKRQGVDGHRVIDSQMLSAEELRGILTNSTKVVEAEALPQIEHSDSGEQA